MANRNWANGGKIYSMHVNVVLTNATILIGATGAVTSFTGSTVQSVVRNSTGIYTLTLQPQTNFSGLFASAGSMQSPASGLSGVLAIELQNAPATTLANSTASAGGIFTIKCLDAAGALVDPASGSSVNVMLLCNNSSVKA